MKTLIPRTRGQWLTREGFSLGEHQCFNSPPACWSLPGANLGQCQHELMPTAFSNQDFLHRRLLETRKDTDTPHTSTFSMDLCSSTWIAEQVPPNAPRPPAAQHKALVSRGHWMPPVTSRPTPPSNLKLKVPWQPRQHPLDVEGTRADDARGWQMGLLLPVKPHKLHSKEAELWLPL